MLSWRMERELIDPVGSLGVVDTVRRTCGIQAQVPSSAELAVSLRRQVSRPDDVRQALLDRTLMRTWAMRGTLHLLEPEEAGAYLALIAASRSWERPAWQRTFGLTPAQIDTLAEIVDEVLDGRTLLREELIDEIAARTGSRELDEQLRSGWSAALKPLAWTGHLCQGPSRGNRVTFTAPRSWAPSWRGLPELVAAAQVAIPAYLHVYGPATIKAFDAWLTRGRSRAADLRRWLDAVQDRLVAVDVEGRGCWALAEDLDALQAASDARAVRLLAGFDQYLLGPGTGDASILAEERRREVSKAAGWISPVVLSAGRVAGVCELDGDVLRIGLFAESRGIAADRLDAEAGRVGAAIGRELRVSIETR